MGMKGKTVAVTGANGNLGMAVCKLAYDRGANVVMLDLDFSDEARQFPALHYPVDLLNPAATAACFSELGDVDALCNIAGGFAMGSRVHEATDEEWEQMYSLNVKTMLNSIRAVVPGMQARRAGCIVNVGAAAALRGEALMAPYLVAKSAVIRITEAMSEELKAEGVNVNCVLPSIIDTPQNREAMPDADFSDWVSVQQLAYAICFLISDEARGVVGASLPVRNLC